MQGKLRNVTSQEIRCTGGFGCSAICEVREITPKELDCSPFPACPTIYEVRRLTPAELECGVGSVCPDIYETNAVSYLVIGKIIDTDKAGLAAVVGEGQAVIEVPRNLIDKRLS